MRKPALLLSSLAISSVVLTLAACGGGSDTTGPDAVANAADSPAAVQNRARNHSTTKSTQATGTNATPSAVTCSTGTRSTFYGINGHLNMGGAYSKSSFATQIAQVQDLGFALYRNDVIDQWGANNVAAFAKQAKATSGPCVTIYPTIGPNNSDWGSNETDAYNRAYALGKASATAMKGSVPVYEVGNEMENAALVGNGDGNKPSDYDNTWFSKGRGVINGTIDGIRSVDTTTPIILSSISWLHFGFDDMLLGGTGPDGSSGHQIPKVDAVAFHWYSDMGDIENACGGTGCYNALQKMASYGKPIWLTEYGARPEMGSQSTIASYIVGNKMLGDFATLAAKYNIQSTELYQLYDDASNGGDGNYGVIQDDGKTQKTSYAKVKAFIAANPK
ncbi:glycosyl hydrolase [Caballeronia sp. LZ033]|uniref:glycosyl hydrolase n=1 Tax=Caballeronia sp. LZ033 TaxID=3038566 RepID=UPI00285500DD|nr:glycosyl hydrolase [Caballeronia sp. LZ033]MDR5816101.1 glycosyl hydrolase [Caballeronia sp. LZ033]